MGGGGGGVEDPMLCVTGHAEQEDVRASSERDLAAQCTVFVGRTVLVHFFIFIFWWLV